MTIDSDSETDQPKKKHPTKKKAPVIVPADEEDIQVNKDFNMDDLVDMGYKKTTQAGGGQSGAKFENKTLWSYSEAVKTDNHGAEGREPEKEFPSLEDRISTKLEEYGIKISEVAGLNIQKVDPEEERA